MSTSIRSARAFKIAAGLVIAASFFSFAQVAAASPGPNSFSKGKVTLTFDDGNKSAYNAVITDNLLGSFKSTHYISTVTMFGATNCVGTCFQEYTTISEVANIKAAGHEITAHTRGHRDLSGLSGTDSLFEINGSRLDMLAQFAGITSNNLAYPFGGYNSTVQNQLKAAGFVGGRTVDIIGAGGTPVLNNAASDPFALRAGQVNIDTPIDGDDPVPAGWGPNFGTVESWIDQAIADKEWLVLVFHEVKADCGTESFCITPTKLSQIVSYLQGKGSTVDVVTMGQALATLGVATGDGQAPVVSISEAVNNVVTAEATSDTGGPVDFTPVVQDSNNGLNALCTIPTTQEFTQLDGQSIATGVFYPIVVASGSTFPLGTTTVTCKAADVGGVVGSYAFSVVVTNPHQTITFDPADKTYGDAPFVLTATSGSGLPVSFELISGPVTLTGATTTITGAGEVVIKASVPGDATHQPAEVQKSFTINKKALTVTAPSQSVVYGTTPAPFTVTIDGFVLGETSAVLDVAPTSTVAGEHTAMGTYPIVPAGGVDNNYSFSYVNGTLTILAQPGDITIDTASLSVTYDGLPHAVVATSSHPFSVTYSGSATAPTNAGSYNVVATITDPNFSGTASSTLLINKRPITITIANNSKLRGQADPVPVSTFATTSGSFVGTDHFTTASIARQPGESGGTYAINGTFDAGANYEVTVVPGIFTINADPNNPGPVAQPQSVQVLQNSSLAITLTATGGIEEGETLTFSTSTNPSHGTLTGSGATLTYTPSQDYFGADSFTFRASDDNSSTEASVTINVYFVPTCTVGTLSGDVCVQEPIECPEGVASTTQEGLCQPDPVPAQCNVAGYHPEGGICIKDVVVPPTPEPVETSSGSSHHRGGIIVRRPIGEVLGAQTGEMCPAYLGGYVRLNAQNDPAVVKELQAFLNDFESNKLEVTGVYDESTLAAVLAFQTKYAADILAPWGLKQATGIVYYTTKKKIDEIHCAFTREFPLSEAQLQEIARMRGLGQAYVAPAYTAPASRPASSPVAKPAATVATPNSAAAGASVAQPAATTKPAATTTKAAPTKSWFDSFVGWLFGK